MANLTIWHGSVKVFPVESSTNPDEVSPSDKFNTCEYRSGEPQTRTIKTCCSSKERTGYACNKLGIFPLSAERCKACKEYRAKQPPAQ